MRFRKIPETAQRNISGLRIREARLACQPTLTQAGLAQRVSDLGLVLDRIAITKIETGQRCVFDHELKCFALALGKSAGWLLGLQDDASSSDPVASGNARRPARRNGV
jgi:hypothetical protein